MSSQVFASLLILLILSFVLGVTPTCQLGPINKQIDLLQGVPAWSAYPLNGTDCMAYALEQDNVCGGAWLQGADVNVNYGTCSPGNPCCFLATNFPCPVSTTATLPSSNDFSFTITCDAMLICNATSSIWTNTSLIPTAAAQDSFLVPDLDSCQSLSLALRITYAYTNATYGLGWTYKESAPATIGRCLTGLPCCYLTYVLDSHTIIPQSDTTATAGLISCSYQS